MQIKEVPTSKLIPYVNNARTHDDTQISQIAASIKEFGFNNPILMADNTILAGHGRLAGAKKLGMKKVPCIDLSHLSETQRKAFILADNRLALNAGWDSELLSIELKLLNDAEFDLELLGFEDKEINALLEPDVIEGETEDDEIPEVDDNAHKVVPGDIWQLGDHRLMCGDSTNVQHVEVALNGKYPEIVYTDPPYGMNAVSKSGVLSKNYSKDIEGDDNSDVAKAAFQLIFNMYDNAKHVWWGANYYSSVLPDSECWMVWNKNNGESDQTDCELAWANFRSVVRMFTQSSEKTGRVHPTQKPVSLVEWIFKRFKYEGNTMFDPFLGSGSTLIACEKTHRKCFGMEIDPHYCSVIIERWQNFTGKKAKRLKKPKNAV